MKMTSESGQVLIVMLLIFSILTGLLIFSAGFVKWTQVKNNTETICRRHYLKAQSYAVKYIKRIKKLNPKATKLRLKIFFLYAKLALLKDPISISAVLFEIKQTKAKQSLLDAKQKSIIKLAQYKIKIETQRLRQKLSKVSNLRIHKIQTVPFNLIAAPPKATAPTYHLPANFAYTQTASAFWRWTDILYLKNLFNFNCSVGVKKRGLNWQPVLKKDKPLLSL